MLKLSPDSLDWALQHALSKGDTDIFPRAFEFQAIDSNWDEVRDCLANQDILSWTSRPLRQCLSPKRRYGFRIATQLDPLDFLIFSALVYEISAKSWAAWMGMAQTGPWARHVWGGSDWTQPNGSRQGWQQADPGFPILAVFRLKGQPKRDGSIIVRSCKASQACVRTPVVRTCHFEIVSKSQA